MHWPRRAQPVLVALLVAALAGWSAGIGTAEGKKLAGPQIVRGEIGPGALYELSMPDAWNGDLVLWVRGLPMEPITLPDISPLRDGLLALGYGVAYSSLSEVGVAVQDGVIRTRQLRGVFASHFGQPRRTYLISSSLGGAMALRLAEENVNHYDGVMPTCGIVGGMPMVIDYFFTVRVLFDYFYPGVVPETPVSEMDFWTVVAPAVAGAIFTDPGPAMELAGVDQVEITYLDMNELLESILLPVFFTNWDFWVGDVRARAHGRDPFDNASGPYSKRA